MNKTIFAFGTMLLMTIVPLVQASDPVRGEIVTEDTDARSGQYIDLATNTVYDYDANTGMLTPAGNGDPAAGYVCVDAYRYGQFPTFWCTLGTGDASRCNYEICASAATRLVGTFIQSRLVIDDYSYWCGWYHTERQTTNQLAVQFWDVRVNIPGWCGGGTMYARLYVNGVQWAYDSTSY